MNTRLMLLRAIAFTTVTLATAGCVDQYGFDPTESPLPSSSPGGDPNGTPPPVPTATPRPTNTPVPTQPPAPTNTPVPTATPRPTNTPVPTQPPAPTNTPVPTATPRPTNTPVPTVAPTGTPGPSPRAVVDTFYPRAAGGASKIDILFCVDSSGSMGNDQAILASSFEDFIVKFTQSGIDAQIGVITSDMTSDGASSGRYWQNTYGSYRNPGLGRLLSKQSGSPWILSSSPNAVSHFSSNALVGTSGSGRERCMSSVLQATASAMLASGGHNAGFFRAGAMPYIIFVTDENEHHVDNNIDALIASFKSRVDSLCIREQGCNGAQVDMVLDLNAQAPSGGVSYPLNTSITNSYPDAYLRAAQVLGSRKLNISANDWGVKLADVGSAVVDQLEKMFKLTHPANLGSIEVRVNGVLLAADQWIYHPSTQSVELANPSIAAGKELKISYMTN